jgi:hypothetical protein
MFTVLLSSKIGKRINRYLIYLCRHLKYIKIESILIDDAIRIRNAHFYGFFQSESYFKHFEDIVKRRFEIKKKFKKEFIKRFGIIFQNEKVIVMHIRRTDYLNFGDEITGGKNLTLPLSYYRSCLKLIHDIHEYKIICVTDEPEFVKTNFKEYDITVENNELIIDFQLIQNADIAIIANSSFSWWAAFLNKNQNKIVYAPEYWFGFKVKEEIPANIIPKSFIKVNVN